MERFGVLLQAHSFNGAPDRNPGKGGVRSSGRSGDQVVSMEPQIGIRGRDQGAGKASTQSRVSMEPQIGIRGRYK